MSRNVIIAMGALLWGTFGVVVVIHAAAGDLTGPLIAAIVVTAVVTVAHLRRRTLRSS
jgi:hypothetical protein